MSRYAWSALISLPQWPWPQFGLGASRVQNMALNVAEKGFPISVFNRSYDKTEAAVKRAEKEGARLGAGAKGVGDGTTA